MQKTVRLWQAGVNVPGHYWPYRKKHAMGATRRKAGLRGNLHGLYRQAMSRCGVASALCKAEVKELPLKGIGEARCRPPRRPA